MSGNIALILAAGRGYRFGDKVPKQYQSLFGQKVLSYSLETFLKCSRIHAVRVMIHPNDIDLYKNVVDDLDVGLILEKLLSPVNGGTTRQDSVRRGLESILDNSADNVVIHDSARPLVSTDIIERGIAQLQNYVGAIVGIPVNDSLKLVEENSANIVDNVSRINVWRAQTPQCFRYKEILSAHRLTVGQNLTDDSSVAETCGYEMTMIEGNENNFKITTEADMQRAEQLLNSDIPYARKPSSKSWITKTGLGFDVHKFSKTGDHLSLCAVRIPFTNGVISHSDGDVALHALVDSILGAIGEGDIGEHFPPSDEIWREANSKIFIDHAMRLLNNKGGRLDHVDITIICEKPRIKSFKKEMVERLEVILGIPRRDINLKATTTEQLGFTGRSEGIAAQAIATIRVPSE